MILDKINLILCLFGMSALGKLTEIALAVVAPRGFTTLQYSGLISMTLKLLIIVSRGRKLDEN